MSLRGRITEHRNKTALRGNLRPITVCQEARGPEEQEARRVAGLVVAAYALPRSEKRSANYGYLSAVS